MIFLPLFYVFCVKVTTKHRLTIVYGNLIKMHVQYTNCVYKFCFAFTVPLPDPNAPKPEGSTITPTVGEQLIVSPRAHTQYSYQFYTQCLHL